MVQQYYEEHEEEILEFWEPPFYDSMLPYLEDREVNIYKWIWSHTPIKRPFTYWLRDLYHKAEFVWIMGLIAIGVVIGHHFDWIAVLIGMGIFTIGYTGGHLFWGSPYIEDQPGE